RNRSVGPRNRASATARMESENRPRAFHNLSEVFRERSTASLLVRSRACGRFGTLAKARTNSSEAKWTFHTFKEMGATESKYRCPCGVVGGPRSRFGRDVLEPWP